MLVKPGEFNGNRILSEKSFQLMLEKHTEAFPNDDEPYLFPDLPGNYFAFNFSVLEDPELDGTGAPSGYQISTFGLILKIKCMDYLCLGQESLILASQLL